MLEAFFCPRSALLTLTRLELGTRLENLSIHLSLRVIRFLVRHVKYLLGLRFEVSGWEHLQTEGPYVVISNHQSSLDVLGGCRVAPTMAVDPCDPLNQQSLEDLSSVLHLLCCQVKQ